MHGHGSGDRSAALAGGQALEGFRLLMVDELGLAAEASMAFSSSGLFLDALAGCLFALAGVEALGAKRANLPIQVLMARRDPAVADFPHQISIQIC